jgi:hypothetical protein
MKVWSKVNSWEDRQPAWLTVVAELVTVLCMSVVAFAAMLLSVALV